MNILWSPIRESEKIIYSFETLNECEKSNTAFSRFLNLRRGVRELRNSWSTAVLRPIDYGG